MKNNMLAIVHGSVACTFGKHLVEANQVLALYHQQADRDSADGSV
jgi:hypothetical protein